VGYRRSLCAGATTLALLISISLAGPTNATPVYLNDQNISVLLVSPASLTGGTVDNLIDADSPSATDAHTQATHVWVSGDSLELRFDLQGIYNLEIFHFWNYFEESFDVDSIDLTFLDASESSVGTFSATPALGIHPSEAENFSLVGIENVRFVNALLAGSNDQVDFQNIGFTGTLIPEPSTALLVGLGLSATALERRRSARRRPTRRCS